MIHAISLGETVKPLPHAGAGAAGRARVVGRAGGAAGGAALGAALALGVVAEKHLYHDDAGEEGDRRISPKE